MTFAADLPQCDQSHLGGPGHHLVHQQGEMSRLALPVLNLILRPLVIRLQPQLLPLQDQVTNGLHPPSDISLKPEIYINFMMFSSDCQSSPVLAVLCCQESHGVIQILHGEGLIRILLNQLWLTPHMLSHTQGAASE